MIVFVNSNNEIKDVNTTTDESLSPLFIDDSQNPFANWSIAKICCYKVNVVDGKVVMYTPYVDSRLIEHFDQLGKQVPKKYSKKAYIDDTTAVFDYVSGVVTANVVNAYGDYIPCYVTISNKIVVSFEPLTELATVTITIQ